MTNSFTNIQVTSHKHYIDSGVAKEWSEWPPWLEQVLKVHKPIKHGNPVISPKRHGQKTTQNT